MVIMNNQNQLSINQPLSCNLWVVDPVVAIKFSVLQQAILVNDRRIEEIQKNRVNVKEVVCGQR